MQSFRSTETSTDLNTQARELLKTILDAATALKRLLPGEEFEHGFEFHWGHYYLSENFPSSARQSTMRGKAYEVAWGGALQQVLTTSFP
jgi:hypothetical protein